MKRKALAALLAVLSTVSATAAHSDVLLTDVTLVDVESDALVPGQSVYIEGSAIAGIGPDIQTRADVDVLDGAGGYLIPGLWDSHVHIFSTPDESQTALPLYLINGVTGVRDMGAL